MYFNQNDDSDQMGSFHPLDVSALSASSVGGYELEPSLGHMQGTITEAWPLSRRGWWLGYSPTAKHSIRNKVYRVITWKLYELIS